MRRLKKSGYNRHQIERDVTSGVSFGSSNVDLEVRQDHVIEKILTSASVLALQMYGVCSHFREVNCVTKVCYNPSFVVQLGTSVSIVSL